MDVAKIKQLRELTGAGIADCREALDANGHDIAKAQQWLKEKGIEKAAKKSDRETSQGRIASYIHGEGKIGVLVELLCETDFVAKTDDFKQLAHDVSLQIAAMAPKDVEELMKQSSIRDPKLTIEDMVKSVIAKLGENIRVSRFTRVALGQ